MKKQIQIAIILFSTYVYSDVIKNIATPIIFETNNQDSLIGLKYTLSYERKISQKLSLEMNANYTYCGNFSEDAQFIRWESYGVNGGFIYNAYSKWIFDLNLSQSIGYSHIYGEKEAWISMTGEGPSLPYEKINDNRVYIQSSIGIRSKFFKEILIVDVTPLNIALGYKYNSIYPSLSLGFQF